MCIKKTYLQCLSRDSIILSFNDNGDTSVHMLSFSACDGIIGIPLRCLWGSRCVPRVRPQRAGYVLPYNEGQQQFFNLSSTKGNRNHFFFKSQRL